MYTFSFPLTGNGNDAPCRLYAAVQYSITATENNTTPDMDQYICMAKRMADYKKGGFVTCENILSLISAAADVLVGCDRSKILVVAKHPELFAGAGVQTARPSVIKTPEKFSTNVELIFITDFFRGYRGCKFYVHCGINTQSVWVVHDPDAAKSTNSVVRATMYALWGLSYYAPTILFKGHVSKVVMYEQTRAERYISFMGIVANDLRNKTVVDLDELSFIPHLNYAKLLMTDTPDMSMYAAIKSAADLYDSRLEAITPLADRVFGTEPLGHVELLSDPECLYSCGKALRAELEKYAEGEAVVAVKNASYTSYVKSVVGNLAVVKTFTQLLKNWGSLAAKIASNPDVRAVSFEPRDFMLRELASNSLMRANWGFGKMCGKLEDYIRCGVL
ncbi:hypothetical protein [European catfish virus]|uniref:Uncharacterized protein n=1 Tax=European catfish virus TaxID=84739 RepID=I2BFR1_9VIRU|nr:hypothetical protein A190_gp081 [European catfish virus]AFJ52364.1 hypothetical protein [European catfish virus]AMZ04910.1 hypothetical protein [European catfish virus]AMZ05046.1 hypothetical protein [European catfish virus]